MKKIYLISILLILLTFRATIAAKETIILPHMDKYCGCTFGMSRKNVLSYLKTLNKEGEIGEINEVSGGSIFVSRKPNLNLCQQYVGFSFNENNNKLATIKMLVSVGPEDVDKFEYDLKTLLPKYRLLFGEPVDKIENVNCTEMLTNPRQKIPLGTMTCYFWKHKDRAHSRYALLWWVKEKNGALRYGLDIRDALLNDTIELVPYMNAKTQASFILGTIYKKDENN